MESLIEDFIETTAVDSDDLLVNDYLSIVLYLYESGRYGYNTYYNRNQHFFERFLSHHPNDLLEDCSLRSGMTGFAMLLTFLKKNGHIQLDLEKELSELDLQLCLQYARNNSACENSFLDGALGYLHYLSFRDFSSEIIEQNASVLMHSIETYSTSTTKEKNDTWLENDKVLLGLLLLNLYEKHFQFKWLKQEILAIAESILSDSKNICSCQQQLISSLFLYRVHFNFVNANYVQEAKALGIQSFCNLSSQARGIDNPYLYNGTSGIACLYKALYKLTGEFTYITAYKFWLGQTEIKTKEVLKYKRNTPLSHLGSILHGIVGSLLLLNSQGTQNDNWLSIILLNS
ncbi:hypothetical protein [Olivibacter sitiensis]|uniref:hypothetical protein n=1 Tax=Olivibacter sitiensis TaxID=376470 RepID=UPI0004824372|nr:hypothetical protein [Olivibacter sitiensis]